MALALYRKYRPRTFAEVIGQEHVTEPLSQALRSGRLHHAYLFSGPRGCGKTSSARILARSLNCAQGPTPEPCGACPSCRSLTNDGGGSIDVIEIDAASHGGVDDARELREKAFFAPVSSRYKIYVIDEAHMVSSAGFNALLKLVEEPPDYVKFIFATTEPEKVLGTIKSRTHHYPFRLIPPAVLRPYLQQLAEAEGIPVEPAVFPLVVRAGGGSARDTLSVLDQLIAGAGPEGVSYARAVALLGVTDVTLIDEMCDALAAGDGATAFAAIDRVAEAGHDPRRFAADLLERFRDLIILQQVPDAVTKGLIDGPADQLEAMAAQATRLGPATLSRCADIVHNGLVEMRGTTAPRLLLELITARMLLPGADDSAGALLQRLERMERRLTLGADTTQAPHSVRPDPAPDIASGEVDVTDAVKSRGVASSSGPSAARAALQAAGRRSGQPHPPAAQSPVRQGSAGPGSTTGPGSAGPGWAGPGSADSGTGDAGSTDPAPIGDGPAGRRSPSSGRVGDGLLGHGSVGRGAAADESAEMRDRSVVPTANAVEPSSQGGENGSDPGRAIPPEPEVGMTDGSSSDDVGDAEPADPVMGIRPASHSVSEGGVGAGSSGVADVSFVSSGGSEGAAGSGVADVNPVPDGGGLLPDSPADIAGEAAAVAASAQLSAAAVREVWPEIITTVGRKSKKIAALASGATVRDLDGETVVLTFRFPAHARMVAADPAPIVDALYEALGGNWQIRCDVSGEAGGVQAAPVATPRIPSTPPGSTWSDGPPQSSGSGQVDGSARPSGSGQLDGPARSSGSGQGAGPVRPSGSGQVDGAPHSSAAPQGDGPLRSSEPGHGDPLAQPPFQATSSGQSAEPMPAGLAVQSPVAAPAGRSTPAGRSAPAPATVQAASPTRVPARQREPGSGASGRSAPADDDDWPEPAKPGGGQQSGSTEAGATGAAATGDSDRAELTGGDADSAGGVPPGDVAHDPASPSGSRPRAGTTASPAPDDQASPIGERVGEQRSRPAPQNRSGGQVAGRTSVGGPAPGSGRAAARAAAAAAADGRSRTPGRAPTRSETFSDGSPTEEPPDEADYEEQPPGGVDFAGFDPGDEPLDEIIDEKVARQNSEQQALQVLLDAFAGSEQIGQQG